MKTNMLLKRLGALGLAFALTLSMMPVHALATETGEPEALPTAEATEAEAAAEDTVAPEAEIPEEDEASDQTAPAEEGLKEETAAEETEHAVILEQAEIADAELVAAEKEVMLESLMSNLISQPNDVMPMSLTTTKIGLGTTKIPVNPAKSVPDVVYEFTPSVSGIYMIAINLAANIHIGYSDDLDAISTGSFQGFLDMDGDAFIGYEGEPFYMAFWNIDEEAGTITAPVQISLLQEISSQDTVDALDKISKGAISLKTPVSLTLEADEGIYYYSFTPSASGDYTIYARKAEGYSMPAFVLTDSRYQVKDKHIYVGSPLTFHLTAGTKYMIGITDSAILDEEESSGDTYELYLQKTSDTKAAVSGDTLTISGNGYLPAWTESLNIDGVKKVNIQEGITVLWEGAFLEWDIDSVSLPASLKSIDDGVFMLSGIQTASIASGSKLAEIGMGAFLGCENLKEFTIPASVQKVGMAAFNGSGVETITIEGCPKTIDIAAFSDCVNLTTVTCKGAQCIWDTSIFDGDKVTVYYPGDDSWDISKITMSADADVTFEEIHVALNGLHKVDGTWAYYKDDEIDTTVTGFYKGAGGWMYVTNGYLDTTYTGMAKNQYGWYYVTNGLLDTTFTGMAKNQYGWFYMKDGKLDQTYTGMAKNQYGWWYMTKGKLDLTYTGMAKNDYGWWYMTKGKLDQTYTGLADNAYGTWYMKNGKLDQTYTGFVSNSTSKWYVVKGKVQKTFSGKVTVGDTIYTISSGKVTAETPVGQTPPEPEKPQPETPQPVVYVVNATSLTVRSGAGSSYSKLGTLANKAEVKVLEVKNNWGRIDYNGKTGWVSMDYLVKKTDGGTTPGNTTSGTVYIVTTALSVRSGAGASYSKLGTLAQNSKITVLEVKGSWGRINYNGKDGWVSLDYCKKEGETTTPSGTVYKVTGTSLTVRSGAGTSYSKLGTLSKDTRITVLEIKNNWGRIDYNGKTGWVSMDYCQKQ